ncbi:6-phosphofructokinase [Treponema phagedenis]|uniref:ATP-dependent 6-phosphofructokinase n=1 Tax=Treponema phagedenis TaxID=162 RepID=A0A0B7GSK3_TREPH|nr:ATP-dependent 6-phosphofructokinase [Treponema phagedenis]NVP25139.1 6-phosphofructokinase [Treponema phagedenis]QEJ96085.1 6-phosphofructokinase [Treponema phagedenis]QEJ97253.1 6-phosphofructokinase [Treponema phagedenis]QEK01848.1 6-phosphofructokinase [Treponema phagedenis]QEK02554.1 6-phosphofructokinase [Treponema phagedenis]
MSAKQRIGILTSGGDAPGLNAGIRAVSRTLINRYDMTVIGIEKGYKGLIENQHRILTANELSGILARGGTILGTSREKPFKDKDWKADSGFGAVDKIKKNYKNLRLDGLIVLGGNGTHTTAHLLAQEGLRIIGMPKTIDNDIVCTDITFGFYTALDVATNAIDRLHSTATSHNRVMIIEVMGHKAGWLTLYSGVAGGGDVIIIPEIPYDISCIAEHLKKRAAGGKEFSIVVVAEGAISITEKDYDKKTLKKIRSKMTGSISYQIAREIEASTGLEPRVTVLGYLQRGGIPCANDRLLATEFGTAAADMAAREDYGKMVALQNNKIVSVPLADVADKIKPVPMDDPMILAAKNVGTCLADN